jgi:hypothetical protein
MNKNLTKHLIYKYTSSNPKFTFTKKKNNFIVSKGFFNYQINKKKLSCPCSDTLCEHIIYFLTGVIGITMNDLIFFNKLKKDLISLLNEEEDFSIVRTKINNLIDSDFDCLICYCHLSDKKFNKDIVECSNCFNYCHKYCFDLYKAKNALLSDVCIHCKSGNMT